MCCVYVRMRCVRTCWCADADDCKKEKRKVTERKKRKENLLNTNPGARICMRTRHMGVQMAWMRMVVEENERKKEKEKRLAGVDADAWWMRNG